MRVVSLVTQKGGTGKSTLATSLSVAAVQAGLRVAAFDLDPQGTLAAWGNAREADEPRVVTVPPERMGDLGGVLKGVAPHYDLAVLDTAGRHDPVTVAAMGLSDLCLVPLRPTRPDGLAVRPTVEALVRGGRRWGFVLNQSPPGRNTRAAEMAAGLGTLGVMAATMHSRADYQDAFAAGQGVTEYAPKGAAADEVRELWGWVEREMVK